MIFNAELLLVRPRWSFKWVSSGGSDFNFDYQASFTPEEMATKDKKTGELKEVMGQDSS